jgi:hypothetical protein
MKLLVEWIPLNLNASLIKESRDKNEGKLILSGKIQHGNEGNQNKRKYPTPILRREIDNYLKAVRENRAVGELDHPDSSTISLDRVSHIFREIWWIGDEVHGRLEVLPTPKGKTLETLLESGVQVGISSRGVGSTELDNFGYDVVQPDYQIICFDIVSEPSTPGAYLFREANERNFRTTFCKADRIFRALNSIVIK